MAPAAPAARLPDTTGTEPLRSDRGVLAGAELSVSRMVDAPADEVFDAWTDPGLLHQWFATRPWIASMVLTFEDHGDRTKYTARVLHSSPAGQETHESPAWGQCASELDALVSKL